MEISKIIEKNKSAIVLLRLVKPMPNNQTAVSVRGTGFVVSEEGKFITNAHVYKQIPNGDLGFLEAQVLDHTNEHKIEFYKSYKVKLLMTDEENDIVLMQLLGSESKFSTIKAKLGNTDFVKEGDEVLLLGFPLATELIAMKFGITMSANHCIVSAVKRRGKDGSLHFFMVDTHINNGSSGSPVFLRESGEIVGIASGRIGFRVQTDPTDQSKFAEVSANMGICRPINYAKKILEL